MSTLILALDTSGPVASVALARRADNETRLIAGWRLQSGFTHSETLMPMLEKMRELAAVELSEISAVAVTSGPGSFTGLRIGASAAKGLAFSLDVPVIAVPTLEAMAYRLAGCAGVVCPMLDARREQVYTAAYRMDTEEMVRGSVRVPVPALIDTCAVPVTEMIEKLNALDAPVHLTGDGVPVYRRVLEERLKVPYRFVPFHQDRQDAESVAALAFFYYDEKRMTDADAFVPEYLRSPRAERERKEMSLDG